MLPWGARATCYPGQSKAKESKAEASKAKESRSKANQTVTPRVAHVTPGRACHMLPWGARVTCYPGQSKAKESKAEASKSKVMMMMIMVMMMMVMGTLGDDHVSFI